MEERKLVIPWLLYQKLREHLYSSESVEREAFMVGGWTGNILLCRKVLPIYSKDLEEEGSYGLSLKDEKKVEVIKECKMENGCLIEAHTHPLSVDDVDFSSYDRKHLKEFSKYVRIRLPNRPYCATVWGKNSVCALIWPAMSESPRPLDEIDIRGSTLEKIATTNSKEKIGHTFPSPDSSIYDRQVRAFGEEGQKAISNFRVAIVGVGGIGSHILQQLAYLGVREMMIFDDDKVEKTNLNRLIGATTKDIGKFKTTALGKNARRINPTLKVNLDAKSLRSESAIEQLKSVDILFGCVDNDGARLILTELASSYLIPYFDCGTSIEREQKGVTQAGGRVLCYLPMETACLWCSRQIDQKEASFDLASEAERSERVKRGYYNVGGPDPAVVSLNGVVASLAVNEFLALVTGFRKPISLRYDFVSPRTKEQKWDIDSKCVLCQASFGIGDRGNIKRYALSK